MKLSAKIWALMTAILLIAVFIIKFYFIPRADEFLDLSVETQMKRDMLSLEKIITIVVTAAEGDNEMVRRALTSISRENKETSIRLVRSDLIDLHYGKKSQAAPLAPDEKEAFRSGNPLFKKTETNFEYIYPLKAEKVCQRCHRLPTGEPVPAGTVLGLAVKHVPISLLKETDLGYFVRGLFWKNFLLIVGILGVVLLFLFVQILSPIRSLFKRLESVLPEEDMLSGDELSMIGHGLDDLLHLKQTKKKENGK